MLELETQTTPEVPHAKQQNNWVSAHPYTVTLAAACVLIIFGATIVIRHSATNPVTPNITAWGGDTSGTINPSDTVAGTVTAQGDILQQVQDNPPYTYTIPKLTGGTPTPPAQNTNTADSFDYNAVIASVSQGQTTPTTTAPKGVSDITYAFPPANLYAAPSPNATRTPIQKSLYNYGNEVGSSIQSYEQQHPDQTKTLKDQIEDQSNPDKIQAVVQMGHDLEAVGKNLLAIEDVPPVISDAHQKLAQSYITIGKNLALVPLSQGNDALLKSIATYNASADVFAKNFASLVSFFSTYGVTFGADDAGSVFTFTYSSGM